MGDSGHRMSPLREMTVGAVAGAVTEALVYAFDSAKILLQLSGTRPAPGRKVPQQQYAERATLRFRHLFRGMLPSILLGSVPSFGCFFLCYVPLKDGLDTAYPTSSIALSHALLASSVAAIPSPIVAVPSDVIKKTIFSDAPVSYVIALRGLLRRRGVAALFSGWQANLGRDVPFIIVKMTLYEGLSDLYLEWRCRRLSWPSFAASGPRTQLTSVEAASVGFFSGMLAATVTAPMDLVNTRMKSGEFGTVNVAAALVKIFQEGGWRAYFKGVWHRIMITGCGSTVFWAVYTQLQAHIIPNTK